MATVTLTASKYSLNATNTDTSYPITNAYTDTTSTTVARLTPTNTSTNYVDFYGFDFSQIPTGAIIKDVNFKIKAAATNNGDLLSLVLRGNGDISEVKQTNNSTGSVFELSPTVPFATIVALGDDFKFRTQSAATRYYRVFGMEILVTYDMPVPNKVDYIKDGVLKTLIDLTGDTATASDVALGKLFHLANGEQAVGTGGGLEYETGTWSPSSNTTTAPTISFSKTHTGPPAFIAMSKTGTGSNAQNAYLRYNWVDMSRAIADWGTPSSGTWYKSYEFLTYANTSTSETNYTTTHTNDITRINGSSFEPYNGNSKTFRSTYVYNWIAIWV